MPIQIQFRNDTAANWTSANPTLLAGEIGYETNTGRLKIGNGSTAWNSLAYGPVAGSAAAITSGTISGVTISSSTISSSTITSPTITSPTITGAALTAGTTTVSPLDFTAGTNLTTALAGAVEYDGSAFYSSVAASTRGTIPSEQIILLNSAYTLTSQTAAQRLFNASAAGAVSLRVGTHQFECFYSLSSMSATSGSFGFALVGGTGPATFTQQWRSIAQKGTATLTTATATQATYSTAANTTIATASTNTVGYAWIKGIINVTVAGTIIPSVSLGVAAAAVVGVGSYFKVSPFSGTSGATNIAIGNWS
jgi:hypothetical protein